MLEQYATIRTPPPAPRSFGLLATRANLAERTPTRTGSAGVVWSVGGSIVTEGVASVTNGRGGRVTSGTSAPHYIADFLKTHLPSEEEVRHGKRLAIALDADADVGAERIVGADDHERQWSWQNGRWERAGGIKPAPRAVVKDKAVPTIPFRVLDAPALRDDYYCSLLAYSSTAECLAVGLGPHVYLWSESRSKNNLPDSLTAPPGTAHVTSLSFSSDGGGSAILAIGRADGRITLWSPLDQDPRFDSNQPAPVSCVSFCPTTTERSSLRDTQVNVATEELLVGDELGCVYYYSVEWPDQAQRDLWDWHGSLTLLARLTCHSQQICGIAWAPDGDYFATGGNDNQLFLFESKKILQTRPTSAPSVHVRNGTAGSSGTSITAQGEVLGVSLGQQKHLFTLNAAVKALAFAPWQPSLLAAGGGSNDRCVHFFHTRSGVTLATIDCHAQVTSLVWSSGRKEIAATFGFAQPEHPYRIAVFAWPGCGMVVGIPWWGEERALFAVPCPKGPSSQSSRGVRRFPGRAGRGDGEGQPWYQRRTSREGCLVVATSDASIKFHEIWAENRQPSKGEGATGSLGGSQILEAACSSQVEQLGMLR
ncbi:WD40-repeat-containing domain protein [Neohortaea acidophila]|uniref:WD40-repeat-containing domain protein n=1 Tax=Neohortaea acidophila TaxID=245834 RepID=A0A6A6PIF8_9PEZI|nr:WD40-repeat-containing domain protein [Neohortaea acidophila]KAF2479313.1 WD40-repeat-containing domain protein [Neohortaea acidophila]